MSTKRRCMTEMKTCVVCAAEFQPAAHHQLYCGDSCRKQSAAAKMRRRYAERRADLQRRQRELRSGADRFTRTGICVECGAEFETTSAAKKTCTKPCYQARARRRAAAKTLDDEQILRRRELVNRRRAKLGPEFRKKESEYQQWQRRLKPINDELRGEAHRHGQEWTGPELEIALREDLSAQEVAILLGRSLAAVNMARYRARRFPREINLSGVRKGVSARGAM